MWENFRARLPYLFDPWSEQLPRAPTLMHAMIAISILVEGAAVLTTAAAAAIGHEYFALVQVLLYAVCAAAVSFGVASFLRRRGVANRDIWCWDERPADHAGLAPRPGAAIWCGDGSRGRAFALAMACGLVGGLVLGAGAQLYERCLDLIPAIHEAIRAQQALSDKLPGFARSYAIMAVFIAPFAEEYLFRGMVFRTLDRAWGGWRAVWGAAAFFAIYHPATSWLPVGLVGATNAMLFKRSGRLLPAVLLHMTYNAVVAGPLLFR
jgi:membrane protease YdiL (CAAX protease family)